MKTSRPVRCLAISDRRAAGLPATVDPPVGEHGARESLGKIRDGVCAKWSVSACTSVSRSHSAWINSGDRAAQGASSRSGQRRLNGHADRRCVQAGATVQAAAGRRMTQCSYRQLLSTWRTVEMDLWDADTSTCSARATSNSPEMATPIWSPTDRSSAKSASIWRTKQPSPLDRGRFSHKLEGKIASGLTKKHTGEGSQVTVPRAHCSGVCLLVSGFFAQKVFELGKGRFDGFRSREKFSRKRNLALGRQPLAPPHTPRNRASFGRSLVPDHCFHVVPPI
jgi:hypothetical protein